MSKPDAAPRLLPLIALGVGSWCLYAGFCWLSRRFGVETAGPQRPILEAVGLLWAAFVLYLLALFAAVRAEGHRDLLLSVVLFAGAFRVTLLFTEPFQEIDAYRYLWDGQVTLTGISPYRYAPREVLTADSSRPLPDELRLLAALRDSQPALRTILSRIHYSHLPSPYPPTSQAVFALAALTTPPQATVRTHLLILKTWLVLFDLGTLGLLILLLQHTGKPVGWAVAYGWCPLVLKEFANSGHLDSIAVFLTTLFALLLVRLCFPRKTVPAAQQAETVTEAAENRGRRLRHWGKTVLAGLVLGAAIGAKLYPLVLWPLFVETLRRRMHRGAAWTGGITAGLTSVVLLWPMMSPSRNNASPQTASPQNEVNAAQNAARPQSGSLREPSAAGVRSVSGAIRRPTPPVPSAGNRFNLPAEDDGKEEGDGKFPRPFRSEKPRLRRSLSPPVPPAEPETSPTRAKPTSRRAAVKHRPTSRRPVPSDRHDPAAGLKAFLSRWKMNDFLFLLLVENFTPHTNRATQPEPWFVLVPPETRVGIVQGGRTLLWEGVRRAGGNPAEWAEADVPFLLARGITLLLFAGLALWWAVRAGRACSAEAVLQAVFLTLAWFWLLSPTLNPWYWSWAVPFLPFARGRSWLLMSGVVLAYYLRFWFAYHFAGTAVGGTPYRGAAFFDFVVVWFEFAPWFVLLGLAAAIRRRAATRGTGMGHE